jgi:N-acetylneuraminate synthase
VKPVLIIAEIGSVHDGSFGNALKLIEASVSSGANAVKFQTHIAAAETLPDAPAPAYFSGEPRYEYFERTSFSRDQWKWLKLHCDELGIEFMSSPFSVEALELLESLGVKRYKVPSGEVTNLALLAQIATTGKPVLLSSGMSSWAELDAAVEVILKGNSQVTLLQCTSEYPCAYENVGLNVMSEMKQRYDLPVGLSDHTLTPYASLAAVVLGASVIERHFTLSRMMYGSDARHSLEPAEFSELVNGIRAIQTLLVSSVDKDRQAAELGEMKRIFEKSVVSVVDIPSGSIITDQMVAVKKPGTGIPARRLPEVIGQRAKKSIPKDRLVKEEDLSCV